MISQAGIEQVLATFSPHLHLVDVQGWLTPVQQQALHALAALTRGPVLEIGPWIGRSTCCLARGLLLRSERMPGDRVVSIELNPDDSYFRRNADGDVEFWCPGDTEMRGIAKADLFDTHAAPVISSPGGIVARLKETLARHHLQHLVEIIVGDFKDVLPVARYGLIFSDVCHTPYEIERMVAGLRPVLTPGTLLCCHDTTPENRDALEQAIAYDWTTMSGSLHIGMIGEA
ncbi:methyltransferase family protein [Hoeflea marina]|uniref:Methyltransferase family protein n=1 Tax=Hoeflea marina TaxID=274592 RepID=A0A317PMR1_9HYPH|nr:class I SAM-dependent methyltransferase [Hoeflea marina]PWW01549.1 methyltransferase family protein [Hoeflea marina]